MKRYVIVGNGAAAVGCIEGIRSADPDGGITVISEEPYPAYCRPLISYYMEGKAALENMPYREEGFYGTAGAEVLYGKKAVRLDTCEKRVFTHDGQALPYDALCVAAGSSPFVPPFAGLDTVENKHTFLTLDDALGLARATERPCRVLIVGAGLIGLKCAEGLRDRAESITVCDLAPNVLSSILDAHSAGIVQRHLENNGLRFLLGNSVRVFEGDRAVMTDGGTVDFDLLVLAVGVRANAGLLREIPGAVNRGIVTDARMRASVPDVYAAGDCAEGPDSALGANRILAILPNAYMQGFTAGVNMAGGSASFDTAIPMNAIGFFGLHLMTAGVYTGEESGEADAYGCKKFFTENGLLKGFILIGETQRAGLYTSLIREKIPLEGIDFELLKKTATSAAFPRGKRKTMFAGRETEC